MNLKSPSLTRSPISFFLTVLLIGACTSPDQRYLERINHAPDVETEARSAVNQINGKKRDSVPSNAMIADFEQTTNLLANWDASLAGIQSVMSEFEGLYSNSQHKDLQGEKAAKLETTRNKIRQAFENGLKVTVNDVPQLYLKDAQAKAQGISQKLKAIAQSYQRFFVSQDAFPEPRITVNAMNAQLQAQFDNLPQIKLQKEVGFVWPEQTILTETRSKVGPYGYADFILRSGNDELLYFGTAEGFAQSGRQDRFFENQRSGYVGFTRDGSAVLRGLESPWQGQQFIVTNGKAPGAFGVEKADVIGSFRKESLVFGRQEGESVYQIHSQDGATPIAKSIKRTVNNAKEFAIQDQNGVDVARVYSSSLMWIIEIKRFDVLDPRTITTIALFAATSAREDRLAEEKLKEEEKQRKAEEARKQAEIEAKRTQSQAPIQAPVGIAIKNSGPKNSGPKDAGPKPSQAPLAQAKSAKQGTLKVSRNTDGSLQISGENWVKGGVNDWDFNIEVNGERAWKNNQAMSGGKFNMTVSRQLLIGHEGKGKLPVNSIVLVVYQWDGNKNHLRMPTQF